MTKLSDTQSIILSAAAQHEMGLARAPKTLPAAARNAVFRSLIKNNLLTDINAPRDYVSLGWRQVEDGTWIVARITDEGLRAIGIDPNEGDADSQPAPAVAPLRAIGVAPGGDRPGVDGDMPVAHQGDSLAAVTLSPPPGEPDTFQAAQQASQAREMSGRGQALRQAAIAVLAAWDTDQRAGLQAAVAQLRTVLSGTTNRRDPGGPRSPRISTKQAAVLALLRRPAGASIAQVMEATAWQPLTVRGFFAGLKKKGHAVEVLERIRQVGPGQQGAKGSYSVYRLAEAG